MAFFEALSDLLIYFDCLGNLGSPLKPSICCTWFVTSLCLSQADTFQFLVCSPPYLHWSSNSSSALRTPFKCQPADVSPFSSTYVPQSLILCSHCFQILVWNVLIQNSLSMILPNQNIPKILLRHFFTNTCNFSSRFWSFSKSCIQIKAQTNFAFKHFYFHSTCNWGLQRFLFGPDSFFPVFIDSSFFSHHASQVSKTINPFYGFSICVQCFLSVSVNLIL